MQAGTRVKGVNRVNINKAMNPLTMTMNGPYIPISFHTQISFVKHKSSALVNGQAVSSRQVSLRVSNFTLDLRNAVHTTNSEFLLL
jgi:hypothetical protein